MANLKSLINSKNLVSIRVHEHNLPSEIRNKRVATRKPSVEGVTFDAGSQGTIKGQSVKIFRKV